MTVAELIRLSDVASPITDIEVVFGTLNRHETVQVGVVERTRF